MRLIRRVAATNAAELEKLWSTDPVDAEHLGEQ